MENTNTNRLIEEATKLGWQAFADGKKDVPAHDFMVMNLIKSNDGNALIILEAWVKAWDAANMAAPW